MKIMLQAQRKGATYPTPLSRIRSDNGIIVIHCLIQSDQLQVKELERPARPQMEELPGGAQEVYAPPKDK